MVFHPVIDGRTLDFYGAGFFDGMAVLSDRQTGSYWDHLTGEAVYGPLAGAVLRRISGLEHSRASVIARAHPTAGYVPVVLDAVHASFLEPIGQIMAADHPEWPAPIFKTLEEDHIEDTRLPRYEMGLGIWAGQQARFYRIGTLHGRDNMLFDTFNDRRVLIYIDPETAAPAALYTDATEGNWRGDTLALNNGTGIRDGILMQHGEALQPERPQQLLQRWYGFSITYPGCEIYRPQARA